MKLTVTVNNGTTPVSPCEVLEHLSEGSDPAVIRYFEHECGEERLGKLVTRVTPKDGPNRHERRRKAALAKRRPNAR